MSDINIRKQGHAGRITLTRPKALNALTYDMVLKIEAALDAWAVDDDIALVIIDATGEKAFCAGGDIVEMYKSAKAGDFEYGRNFWRDEYRLNAKIAHFPKPYVAFMQGYTMGGGVGISCHGTHRIVGESANISMPECRIGLVPDVGGSLLLAKAPGYLGEFLAMTGEFLHATDAIFANFATHYVPEVFWPSLIAALAQTGDVSLIDVKAQEVDLPKPEWIERGAAEINTIFAAQNYADLLKNIDQAEAGADWEVVHNVAKSSPLSAACAVELLRRVRATPTIEFALKQEFRFTYRSASDGEFIEGIRAGVIDRSTPPKWRHSDLEDVDMSDVTAMLAPLGDQELKLGE